MITVVIGTLNRPVVALHLVNQLKKTSEKEDIEVIVVDQSTRDNFSKLKEKFPESDNFRLAHFDTPNTCKYLNYGWKNAKAPIVLYLDDDVEITSRTVAAHLSEYTNQKVLGVSGRVINDGEKVTKSSRVGRVGWFGATFSMNFSYDKPTSVDFPYGCNMSYRKGILERLSGFDEKLSGPIYSYNEIDMGVRVNMLEPGSIVFSPDALVYHHKHKTGGTRNNFELENIFVGNHFNYGYVLGKNFSYFQNFVCLLRRFPYQLLQEPDAIQHIINGFLFAKKNK